MVQTTPGRRRGQERERWLLVACGVFFLLVLVVGAGFISEKIRSARDHAEVQKRLAAMRAAGLPMTAQDVAKLYPDPPPDKDAVRLLQPALARLSLPDESTNLLFFDLFPPRTGPLAPAVITESRLWLDRNQPALALIPWSQLDGTWVGCSFNLGFTNLTDGPVSEMNRLVRLLCLSAVLNAEQQHPRETLQSLKHAATIAHIFKNVPPIQIAVKADDEYRICDALERILNQISLSDQELVTSSGFLSLTQVGATKENMLNFYRPWVLYYADYLQSGAAQLPGRVNSPWRWSFKAHQGMQRYQDSDLLHYLNWSDQCLAALDTPMTNAIPMLRVIEEQQEIVRQQRHNSFLNVFTTEHTPPLSRWELQTTAFLLPELKIVAHERLAVTALAVERWRITHGGRPPASLTDLVPGFLPALPADPYDGRPLRYLNRTNSYVLYSIGEDLTDDGGQEEPEEPTATQHYDLTFTVDLHGR
jgi:hypothetical protein